MKEEEIEAMVLTHKAMFKLLMLQKFKSLKVNPLKNHYTDTARLLSDDLCLCGSYRGISNKLTLFHNLLETPCSSL